MLKVYKSSKESFERFLSRFEHAVQRARIVRILREKRYHARPPTKRRIRAAALMRAYHRTRREKMKFY